MVDQTPVTLDVEGRTFKTIVGTLTRVPGCYFHDFFRDGWRSRLNAEGNVFIDRDGELFPVVLGYLRDGSHFPLPQDEYQLDRLEQEAKFYRLPELVDLVEKQRTYGALPLTSRRSTTPPPPPPVPSKPKIRPKELLRRLSTEEVKVPRKPARKIPSNAKGLRKEDIGGPSNFVHVVHVGWHDQVPPRINDHHMKLESTVQAVLRAMGYSDSDLERRSNISLTAQPTAPPKRSVSASNALRMGGIDEEEPIYSLVEGHGAKSVAHQVIFTKSSIEMLPETVRPGSTNAPPRVKKRAPPVPAKPQKSIFSQAHEPDEPKPTVRLAKYEKTPSM